MISGGEGEGGDDLSSAEIYNPKTRGGCRIANMPTSRSAAVTQEFLACGDRGGHNRDCVNYDPESGRWENAHKLNQDRFG